MAKHERLKQLMQSFSAEMGALEFSAPVAYVYNPLDYAWAGHAAFLDRFYARADAPWPSTLLVTMNPGPHGMSQTGVPFGAPALMRSWMGIDLAPDAIRPPPVECPSRPVFGFAPVPVSTLAPAPAPAPTTTVADVDADLTPSPNNNNKKKRKTKPAAVPRLREEASAKRIYGDWARHAFGTADAFFAACFLHTYCPLQFMAASGTNVTPTELARADRDRIAAVCDGYLRRVAALVRPAASSPSATTPKPASRPSPRVARRPRRRSQARAREHRRRQRRKERSRRRT